MRKYKNIKQMAEILKIQESDLLYFLEGGYFENNYTQVQKSIDYPNGYMFRGRHIEIIKKIKLPTAPSQFRMKREEVVLEHRFTATETPSGGIEITFQDGESHTLCPRWPDPGKIEIDKIPEEPGSGYNCRCETFPIDEPDIAHLIDQVVKAEKPKRKRVKKVENA